jgi:hypothetical protein
MKRVVHIAVAAALMGLSSTVGAQDARSQQAPPAKDAQASKERAQRQEVRKEVGEAVDSIRNYSYERRQEAMAVARRSMDELDAQFDKLQAQSQADWARMSEATRSRSQRSAQALRRQRNALSEWYGGMRQSSATAWDEVKAGFVSSYHDLAAAIRQARDDMREKPAAEPAGDEQEKQDSRKQEPRR